MTERGNRESSLLAGYVFSSTQVQMVELLQVATCNKDTHFPSRKPKINKQCKRGDVEPKPVFESAVVFAWKKYRNIDEIWD